MVVRQLIALPSQLQLIDRLQHLIYLSSSLIFVSGEQGAGKSTLLEQLSNKLPGNVQEVFIQLHEQLTDAQIRQQIIMQLYEEPLFNAQDSLLTSMTLLQEKQQLDVPRLIVFDNADYLSPQLLSELVALLAQKAQLGENEINVLLLADAENSRKMLSWSKQAQQMCVCLEFKLEALSNDEANSLLNHIFRQSGYQHHIQHQDALSKQLKSCAGIPQKIIKLAEQIVAGELQSNEPSWLKTRLPAILLMFSLLAVAAGLANYLYPLFFKPEKVVIDQATESAQSVKHHVLPASAQPAMVEELAGSWDKKVIPDIEENRLQVGVSDASVQHLLISEQSILALATPKSADVASAEIAQDVNDLEKENIVDKLTEAEAESLTKTEPAVEAEPAADAGEVAEVEQLAAQAPETQPEAVVQPVPLPAAIPAVEIVAAHNIREVNNSSATENMVVALTDAPEVASTMQSAKQVPAKDPDWIFTAESALLAIPSAHYTLQLSAMASKKSLQQFVSQYALPKENFYVYQTIRNNKPWYVVIFGEYASWGAAKKASKTLPGSLANLGGWIKKYQLVHQDLRLNNE